MRLPRGQLKWYLAVMGRRALAWSLGLRQAAAARIAQRIFKSNLSGNAHQHIS